MTGEPSRNRAARRIAAGVVVVLGVVVLALTLLAVSEALNRRAVPETWSDGTLYLATRDVAASCVLDTGDAEPYRVEVPRSVRTRLAGVRVEAGADAPVGLECTLGVSASWGTIVLVYPLAEAGEWVLLPTVLIIAVAWVYGRPFTTRRSRRILLWRKS